MWQPNRFLAKYRFLISPWSGIAVLLILVIWLGLANSELRKNINSVKQAMTGASYATNGNNKEPAGLKITSPGETPAMVHENIFQLAGEADDNSVIMLMSRGKLLDVVKPQNGIFKFDNIKITRDHTIFSVQMMSPEGQRYDLETIELQYNNPTLNHLSRSLNRGDQGSPFVALTFDGGSIDNASEEVLNTLNEYGTKSTFFLTGEFIRQFPNTVERILAEGHEVGNHTMSHPHLTTFMEDGRHRTRDEVTKEFFVEELENTRKAFESLTRKKFVPYWRAPFGEHNGELRRWAAELGYRQVGWTVGESDGVTMDTKDWVADPNDPNYNSADQICQNILEFADSSKFGANGAIILMHLGSNRSDDFPHRRLPDIIAGLKERGYQFVAVSELVRM